MTSDHDVIIVGAGLAGGILAGVLAEGGRRVLLLERGRALAYSDIPSDHLRNHRLTLYGDNTTPDPAGHPRVFIDGAGVPHTVLPHDARYQLNAFTVGGGARVWGMQAWRFHPDDFRMATRYGVPDGESGCPEGWPGGTRLAEKRASIAELSSRSRYEPPKATPMAPPVVSASLSALGELPVKPLINHHQRATWAGAHRWRQARLARG